MTENYAQHVLTLVMGIGTILFLICFFCYIISSIIRFKRLVNDEDNEDSDYNTTHLFFCIATISLLWIFDFLYPFYKLSLTI